MKILVAYASRCGATGEIAAHIAQRLSTAGHETTVESVTNAIDVAGYEAFVLGSAVYLGRWEKVAVDFVQRNRIVLAGRPTWLFSSGPLGREPNDAQGHDKREGALLPEQMEALSEAVRPHGHGVFFGVLNPAGLSLGPRLMRLTPAGRKLLEEGDFRDWDAIAAWTDDILQELLQARIPAGATA
jgi:menaquinone-dependent protoporphyrinogen oxidase